MPGRSPLRAVKNAEGKIGKSNQTARRCARCFLEIAEQISTLERNIEPDLGRFIDLRGIVQDVFLLACSLDANLDLTVLTSDSISDSIRARRCITSILNVAFVRRSKLNDGFVASVQHRGRLVKSFGAIPDTCAPFTGPSLGRLKSRPSALSMMRKQFSICAFPMFIFTIAVSCLRSPDCGAFFFVRIRGGASSETSTSSAA